MARKAALTGILLGGLALAGCAHEEDNKALAAKTPSQMYSLKAEAQPDDIALAIHAEGLSAAQDAAVRALAGRWRDAGGAQAIRISAPQASADPAGVYKYAQAVRGRLVAIGVPASAIQQDAYDPAGDAKAPLKISFVGFKADIPVCGQSWQNLTATEANTVQSNFGCAVTANMAAMIADPADITRPRDETSGDAGRRVTVIQAYRKGETTSTAADKQASGEISNAVGGGQ